MNIKTKIQLQDIVQRILSIQNLTDHTTATMCDIETDTLYGRVRSIQLFNHAYNKDEAYFIDLNKMNLSEDAVLKLISPLWTVWANPSYDLGTLKGITTVVDDVQQLSRLAYPQLGKRRGSFSLDRLIKKICKIDAYKGIDKKTMQTKGFAWDVELTSDQIRYAIADVYYMYNLWDNHKIQYERVNNYSYEIDMSVLRVTIQYQQNGCLFDVGKLSIEKTKSEEDLNNNERILDSLNPNSPTQVRYELGYLASESGILLKMGSKDSEIPWYDKDVIDFFNFIVSTKRKSKKAELGDLSKKISDGIAIQVIEDFNSNNISEYMDYLEDYIHTRSLKLLNTMSLKEIKAQVLDEWDRDNFTAKAKAIKYIKDTYDNLELVDIPVIKPMMPTKEQVENRAIKALTVYNQRRVKLKLGYINKYMGGKTSGFNKMYSFFNPYGAKTGRFTSSGKDPKDGEHYTHLNLQQIPRTLQYTTFTDTDNSSVVHADYSTAELRSGCSIMNDKQMYKYLKQGIDLHKVSATFAIDKTVEEITKAERQKGKAISFGLIFGMGIKTFIEQSYKDYGVMFSEKEARRIISKYMKTYKGISKYISDAWEVWDTEPAKSPSGRVSYAETGNAYINYATQSAVADMTKIALIELVKEYPETINYIFSVVHDAIYLRVPQGKEKYYADILVKYMKIGYSNYVTLPMFKFKDIPQPVEVEYNIYNADGSHESICEEY